MSSKNVKISILLLSLLIAPVLCAIINQLDRQQYVAANGSGGGISTDILIIDPGHGGEDGGAVSPDGLVESGINMDISMRVNELCGFFGVRSVMTRESERIEYPSELGSTAARKRWDTQRRVETINSYENAVLLSIHQNNYPDSRPRGPQAFYGRGEGSRELAETIHNNLTAALLPDSRRVAAPVPKEVYIMSKSNCTAVLIECGFLSNPIESTLLKSSEHKSRIAAVLMASYLQYLEAKDEGQNDFLLHGVRQ